MTATFDDLIAANRSYATGFELGELHAAAASGLAVLTCIDSRIEPLPMLGLRPGDAKIVRNAGARATDDAIRSLVFATNLLGVRRIMVLAHTDCAMAGSTDEQLLAKLSEHHHGVDYAGFEPHAATDQLATLAADVERLRTSPLLADHVEVEGFVYDVRTGLVTPAGD